MAYAPEAVLLTEAPVPWGIRVPWWVNAPVSLDRPMNEILGNYDKKIQRILIKRTASCGMSRRRVLDEAEIEEINWSMLEPYAETRHGANTTHVALDTVRRIALGDRGGRLDLIEINGERVACHLGSELSWRGKRLWVAERFGYPEKVFNDRKRFSEINTVNAFLALEWAHQNGFDYYELGGAFARPENGLLQWKRRRGGGLNLRQNEACFYLKLPRRGAGQFLWDAPLFAAERAGIALHLGVPLGPQDDEVCTRYAEMGFPDLVNVHLHCDRRSGELSNGRSFCSRCQLRDLVFGRRAVCSRSG